ncbi:MAG: DUF2794 domain-containing protein [Rhodospirillales bacterium]|jgi:hypothetical protein|nr:DUF2794 domain-containing protein [Rhodospirillales bacterium]MBT4007542.1 DUF2794 domain-containing protein [Rhodospirillales bacterium]MBT5076327.1 DUF2794 domain-containing protein [Rhodospirillales bacterium]MBT5113256.1 DUF2794 domain-containing protein [Rhodospirillales bacterium]MBT5671889.1 DUF2794 domain-containing protein [Rhodospirillales bacterium]
MPKVLRLSDYRRKKGIFCFSRQEMVLLLSVYSQRVISGEWKAYAIDYEGGMAQFSIYVHANAQPLYAVVKFAAPTNRVRKFVVFKGSKKIAQADTLSAALTVFNRNLKLVSS